MEWGNTPLTAHAPVLHTQVIPWYGRYRGYFCSWNSIEWTRELQLSVSVPNFYSFLTRASKVIFSAELLGWLYKPTYCILYTHPLLSRHSFLEKL